jgi:CRP-like cAMP-binding protein
MNQIKYFIRNLIDISNSEFDLFLNNAQLKKFKRLDYLMKPGTLPQEIFFINTGMVRVIVYDQSGIDHTIYFALENQFITDYSSFILKQPSLYAIQALEETETIILPRSSIEWGYQNLRQGEKLGRLIAEYYFIYQDHKIKNQYSRTPKERYDSITEIFPDIHNRVPQHMIASYLGITPVHLSRIKKSDRIKI